MKMEGLRLLLTDIKNIVQDINTNIETLNANVEVLTSGETCSVSDICNKLDTIFHKSRKY
jgi:hypothetical protein